MSIHEALSAVKADLGAVKKGDTMKGGSFSYKYRSIDDVLNALHPILVRHGVVGPVPNVIEHKSSGKKTVIVSGFTWFHKDGSSVSGTTVGEGDDPGDKGANKASTGALKTFLTQSLAIPFDTDDPDHYPSQKEDSKPARKPTEAQKAAHAEGDEGKGAATGSSSAPGVKQCPICETPLGTTGLKKQAGQYCHKACVENKPDSLTTPDSADDIASIIDDFPGAS